jgi:NADP-dependent 3-hydroxy acid dehydrogenase YdfG
MKTFLSIGSGPGLAYATAERFAKEGFRIVFSARTATKTQQLAERLEAKGHKAIARTVNSADPNSVAALITELERDFGSIDVLHYNPAAMRKATITEQPLDTFIPDLALNIGGALAATQTVLKKMSERRSGSILLTGGGYALEPNPERISLSIGKAGIRALTLGLFEPLKALGVHIASVLVMNTVLPESADAGAIGDQFWKLHNQPVGSWTAEVKYSS